MRRLFLCLILASAATGSIGVESAAGSAGATPSPLATSAGTTPSPLEASCDVTDASALGAALLKDSSPKDRLAYLLAKIRGCNTVIDAFIDTKKKHGPSLHPHGLRPNATPMPSPPVPLAPVACTATATAERPLIVYARLTSCIAWMAANMASAAPSAAASANAFLTFHLPLAAATPPAAPASDADSTEDSGADPTATPTAASITSPNPMPTALPSTEPWRKEIFVLALATDAPTSAHIVAIAGGDLRNSMIQPNVYRIDPYTGSFVQYDVVAEPAMTIAQYQQQCASDPTTAGAIVIAQPSVANSSFNFLLFASETRVGLQAVVLDCEPTNEFYENNVSFATWTSNLYTKTGDRIALSVSTILAGFEALAALHPSTSTVTMNSGPSSPSPMSSAAASAGTASSPAPSAMAATQSSTTTVLNGTAGLVGAAGVAASTPLMSTNFGLGPSGDAQFADAVRQDMQMLEFDFAASCLSYTVASAANFPTQCQWLTTNAFTNE